MFVISLIFTLGKEDEKKIINLKIPLEPKKTTTTTLISPLCSSSVKMNVENNAKTDAILNVLDIIIADLDIISTTNNIFQLFLYINKHNDIENNLNDLQTYAMNNDNLINIHNNSSNENIINNSKNNKSKRFDLVINSIRSILMIR
ncbi:hypothetical protein DERP_001567 [Dermatophagoides pteronyssinus]|uniref:Uncharacterized protein n=1 Tax=Dermatophagoides pteronyssinus TaxID=6956 RepID=A0ABQ8JAW8_DERPT|nr:hypothetical protein DERP_001567 [Dermatophagoides pteronyssinus]